METVILVFFVIVLMIMFLYIRFTHDILNPLTLFYLPLIVNYIIFFILYQEEYRISGLTNGMVLLGGASFGAGYFLIYAYGRYVKKNSCQTFKGPTDKGLVINVRIIKLLTAFGLIGFLVGIFEFIYYGFCGEGRFLINVRRNYMYGQGVSPISKYGTFVLFFVSCVQFYQFLDRGKKDRGEKTRICLLMAGSLLSTLFSMARTILLSYVLAYVYIYLRSLYKRVYVTKEMERGKLRSSYKLLIFLFVLLIIAFCFIAKGLGKAGADTLLSKEFFLYKYLGYSLVAFDQYIKGTPGVTCGYYSLGPIGKLLLILGFYQDEMFLNFGAPIGEFNVYSYIGALFLDFGPSGLFFPMFVIGSLSGYIYYRERRNGGWWTIFYANFAYALMISFYAYQFSNTTFLYCMLLILILRIFRGRFYIKQIERETT